MNYWLVVLKKMGCSDQFNLLPALMRMSYVCLTISIDFGIFFFRLLIFFVTAVLRKVSCPAPTPSKDPHLSEIKTNE